MDFFAYQHQAKKRTGLLLLYFALAVACIVLCVYAAVVVAINLAQAQQHQQAAMSVWHPALFAVVTVATLLVIGMGSLFKLVELASGGGAAVAQMLGGELVDPATRELHERRLLNVVEEMAIASGTPVPPVYVLPDDGINAFAAGYNRQDAVVAVTRGALLHLTRDELQGVIGHEFSHIFNGDMKLNIHLMGVLFGILILGIAGYWTVRIVSATGGGRRRDSKDNSGAIIMAVLIIGFALIIIGFAGVFFARLIQAAVSRQREYLADASAVQFTRNPAGLSGALQKIGGLVAGSQIASPNAEQAGHLFFSPGRGAASAASRLDQPSFDPLATHPPLVERIRRIDPSFTGEFKPVLASADSLQSDSDTAPRPVAAMGLAGGAAVDGARVAVTPVRVAAQVGTVSPSHLAHAQQLHAALPPVLVNAAREPYGACTLMFALLLGPHPDLRRQQFANIAKFTDAAMVLATQRLLPAVDQLTPGQRLPLVMLAIPALKSLSANQFDGFRRLVEELAAADSQVDLFEYTVQRLLLAHLAPTYGQVKPPVIRYHALAAVSEACATLLSALAHAGASEESTARAAFTAAVAALALPAGRTQELLPATACTLTAVDAALDTLQGLAPLPKRTLVQACTLCVAADGHITVAEAELLRAIADTLGCPLPPILADDAQ